MHFCELSLEYPLQDEAIRHLYSVSFVSQEQVELLFDFEMVCVTCSYLLQVKAMVCLDSESLGVMDAKWAYVQASF